VPRADARPSPRSRCCERGATAVFVAVLLAGLAALLALAINVGHMMAVRTELQTAADSAALAGAEELALNTNLTTGNVTAFGEIQADTLAAQFSAANQSDATSIALDSASEVDFGVWDGAVYTPTVDPALVNAIRVTAERTSSSPNAPVTVFASALLGGGGTANVTATSIVQVGGRCDLTAPSCPLLPLAVVNCANAPQCAGSAFAPTTGVGGAYWTTYNTGVSLASIVNGAWTCPATGVHVTDCIDVGPPIPAVAQSDLLAVQAVYTPPSTTRVVVPVVCPTAGGCPGGTLQVLGFTTVTVDAVSMGGPLAAGVLLNYSCGADREDLFGASDESGHCPNYGALFARGRLIQ
jgi:Flp pilus assembly protein TadG